MWTGVLLLSLVAAAPYAGQPAPTAAADCTRWQDCRDRVEAALAAESFDTALDLAWRAVQRGPKDDPALMFLLARAQARAGRPQDALVMIRRIAERGGATDAATGASVRRRTSTIGRSGDASSSRSALSTCARSAGSGVITASGFSSRCFRARSRETAASSAASRSTGFCVDSIPDPCLCSSRRRSVYHPRRAAFTTVS